MPRSSLAASATARSSRASPIRSPGFPARSTAISPSSISRPSSPTATTSRRKARARARSTSAATPLALKALIDAGFNLFSLANNHAFDYGAARHRGDALPSRRGQCRAGHRLCRHRQQFRRGDQARLHRPRRHARSVFSAIGIITGDQPQYRAGPDSPGQASYRDRPDFEAAVDKLAAMPADYRILSIHYGLEGRVIPDERQLADWRRFAAEREGHRPHRRPPPACGPRRRARRQVADLLRARQFPASRHRRDDPLRPLPRLRADGQGPSGAHRRRLAGRGDRGDPADQYANAAGSVLARRKRKSASMRSTISPPGSTTTRPPRGVRFTPQADGSGLYCADGAAASRRHDRHAVPGLAAGGRARPEARRPRSTPPAQDKPFYDKPSLVKRRVPARREPPRLPPSVSGFRQF